MNNIQSLNFPVVSIDISQNTWVYLNNEELTTCTTISYKHQFYKSLTIVDSQGYVYKVVNAKKIGYVGIFWGYDLFFNQTIKVELEFEDKYEKLNILEFKEIILGTIDKNPDFWENIGFYEEIKLKIMNANFFEELILMIR